MDEVSKRSANTELLTMGTVPNMWFCTFQIQIQPDLRELMETMNRMSNMPPDFEAKDKVSLW